MGGGDGALATFCRLVGGLGVVRLLSGRPVAAGAAVGVCSSGLGTAGRKFPLWLGRGALRSTKGRMAGWAGLGLLRDLVTTIVLLLISSEFN